MSHIDFALFEAALGYAIFSVVHQADAVGIKLKEVQDASIDLSRFGKMVKLVNFTPFSDQAEALENINSISEGLVTPQLLAILQLNLPQTSGKKSKIILAVSERTLAGAIKAAIPGLECETPETSAIAAEILRGIRFHASKLLKDLEADDIDKASLGMGHAYSRAKVKFSATRNDNHIIQAIATVDFQDKGSNTFFMRLREWYGSHFPELIRIVSDNYTYAKLVQYIGDKTTLTDEKRDGIANLLGQDGQKAQAIIDAAKISMGVELKMDDFVMMVGLARIVLLQSDNRIMTSDYLDTKLDQVAPNLKALVGSTVTARLISHAGSLTNLAKLPSSTVQILGAEKALFRALKTKSNTPKYGLLYNASAIGKAAPKNKGRISRNLANKCSMASRIDLFSEEPTTAFGNAFRNQVDERLEFYASGKRPSKNVDVMKSVIATMNGADDDEIMEAPVPTPSKKEKKDKKEKKKDKKEKKRKRENSEDKDEVPAVNVDAEKKQKKSKKSKKESKSAGDE